MKRKICELLAPAGNPECALAAIDAGADAVYCGLGRFNARCRAENFDSEKLGALIDFMHSKGKRLYLTFNTLLFEDELEAAGEMLSDLVQLAPDALIVHDPGVIRMAKRYFPSLVLHSSTQMGIHNSAGVRAMAGMGVERVILERQIPLHELEKIVRNAPVEIEVFIHGSLCCSLSGRCLLSAELCGGSGVGDEPADSNYYSTVMALAPPVIAIVLALVTKEVYSSLFIGVLAGALGALAATINASSGTVISGYFMTNYQVYAFLAGILGGFGTFYGPVIAALMIPLANNLVQYFVNTIGKPELTGWSMVIVYSIALIIIFFKPQGIFGKKIARKV